MATLSLPWQSHTRYETSLSPHIAAWHSADFRDAVPIPRCLCFTCVVVLLLFLVSFLYLCVCILPGWVSLYHMCAVSLEARDVLDPLGLELQPVVTYPWALAIQPVTSGRAAAALYSWATTPAEPCCCMSCLSKQEREPVVLRDSGCFFFILLKEHCTYCRDQYLKNLKWTRVAGRHCFLRCV